VIYASAALSPAITFQNIAFNNGNANPSSGGAIYNGGTLALNTVTFVGNAAPDGGAIYQVACGGCLLPSAVVGYSNFTGNLAMTGNGGAIRVQDGSFQVHDTDFSSNNAPVGAGGAIFLGQGPAISRSLTVNNGHFSNNASSNAAGTGNGGAIAAVTASTGTVSIDSSTFQGNSCSGVGSSGGAVNVDHTNLTVTGTLFRQNAANAGAYAGAVSAGYGIVAISDTTFDQNSSNSGGSGAVALTGTTGATIQRCTFSANVAQNNGAGGAMVTNGPVGIENSTFSGNSSQGASGYAGAIYVQAGTTDLRNVTVTANSANSDGGIWVSGSSTLTMRNSILSGNTDAGGSNPDLVVNGTFASNGYNLIGSSSGITVAGTDIINPNPNLGALANNGGPNFGNVVVVGPTLTQLPNTGSPAIDAGNPAGCLALNGSALATDQRLLTRPAGLHCDIGAAEVQAAAASATHLAFVQQPTSAVAGQAITPSITVQLQDSTNAPVAQSGTSVTLVLASGTGTLSGTTTQGTNASGLATFSGLSINLIGSKTLGASSSGLTGATSGLFAISAGAATSLVVLGGGAQHAAVSTAFATPLQVMATDGLGNPVSGVSVTFSPPGSGASAAILGSPATTNASGVASVTATANGTTGAYDVVASAGTLPTVNFALTNDPALATSRVPTLGAAGLILLALALAALGATAVRRISP
jgi:adhesin/invasin